MHRRKIISGAKILLLFIMLSMAVSLNSKAAQMNLKDKAVSFLKELNKGKYAAAVEQFDGKMKFSFLLPEGTGTT